VGGASRFFTQAQWECAPGCPIGEIDQQSGDRPVGAAGVKGSSGFVDGYDGESHVPYGDTGGAARFFSQADPDPPEHPVIFYVAKAGPAERPSYVREGDADAWAGSGYRKRCAVCGRQEVNVPGSACECPEPDFQPDPGMQGRVTHPTVKPLALLRHLVRLVTPPGGTVLDPFAGSGTTGEAALLEGMRSLLIERESDYVPLITQRLDRHLRPEEWLRSTGQAEGTLFG
jgi:hypothetical protein